MTKETIKEQPTQDTQLPIHVMFLNALEATIVKENTKPNYTSQT